MSVLYLSKCNTTALHMGALEAMYHVSHRPATIVCMAGSHVTFLSGYSRSHPSCPK